MPEPADQLITINEAAQILGRPADTVRRLARTGVLTAQRLPHAHPRLLRSEVETLARAALVPGALADHHTTPTSLSGDSPDPSISETLSMENPPQLHDPIVVTDLDGGQHRVLVSAIRKGSDANPEIKFASVGAKLSARSSHLPSRWVPFSATPAPGCWSQIPGR